jgi:hypothetical protein
MTWLAGAALWLSGFVIGAVVVAALARRALRAAQARIILAPDGRLVAWRGDLDVATVESWEGFQEAMARLTKTDTEQENGS